MQAQTSLLEENKQYCREGVTIDSPGLADALKLSQSFLDGDEGTRHTGAEVRAAVREFLEYACPLIEDLVLSDLAKIKAKIDSATPRSTEELVIQAQGVAQELLHVSQSLHGELSDHFVSALKTSYEWFDKSSETRSRAISFKGRHRFCLGQQQLARGETQKAADLFKEAIACSAESPGTSSIQHMTHRFKYAEALVLLGRANEAIESYLKLLELINEMPLQLDEKQKNVHNALINVFKSCGMFTEARSHARTSLNITIKQVGLVDPLVAEAMLVVGKLCEISSKSNSRTKLCDMADAIRYYVAALRVYLDCGGAHRETSNKLLAQVADLIYENKPLTPSEIQAMVQTTATSAESAAIFLKDDQQNTFLKMLFPQTIANAALKEKEWEFPSKSGWLTKRGAIVTNWKKRWFKLERDQLFYYKATEDDQPQGTIPVIEISSVSKCNDDRLKGHKSNMIELITKKRVYFMQAESEEDVAEWLDQLTSAVEYWTKWLAV